MTAVKFDHVTKEYDLQAGSRTVFSAIKLVTGSGAASNELFHALSDVSFEVKKGEAFGIIGRNGAGKSTILKIIAGVTKPTRGTVEINGLVSSLIELGAGFHPDLTGRENVYLSGAILGLPKKHLDNKFKEIVDFAELWDFIDVPVKKYSSGMYARLGFAVAVSIEPEILIIDEILSVGDIFFQQKCFTKMRQIIEKNTTFIYVTHDLPAMQNLCDRALLLSHGKMEYLGTSTEAVSRFHAMMGQKPGDSWTRSKQRNDTPSLSEKPTMSYDEVRAHSILRKSRSRHGRRGMEIIGARVTTECGVDTMMVELDHQLTFTLLLRANSEVQEPSCGIHLYNRMGVLVFAAGTRQLGQRLPTMNTGQHLAVSLNLTFSIEPGEYTFSLGCGEPSADGEPNIGYIHDQYEMLGPLVVWCDRNKVLPFYGVAKIPLKIFVEPTRNLSKKD
jgi:lipopolysaccharide transport system ATP-binding protein